MIYKTHYQSPLGEILLACDDQGLTGLWFSDGEKYFADGLSPEAVEKSTEVFRQTKKWLDVYFSGKDPGPIPPVHLVGSDFRNQVGKIMCEIPFGETVTYGEIAKRIAVERNMEHMPTQAVGGAVGKNPISIIVPCHRVVGSNGSLTGYGGGIRRKEALLKLEGASSDKFFVPTKGTAL